MAEQTITMETDWGAKGAQLTGRQVQDFIKGQLRSLQQGVPAPDWLETDKASKNYVKNKPEIVTVSSKPDGTLKSYVNTDGTTVTLKVGDFVRYLDENGEYKFFQVSDIASDGTVSWVEPGSGESTSTERVLITLNTNQSDDSVLIGKKVTITAGGTSEEVAWDGSTIIKKIAANSSYTISVESIDGYATPDSVTYTATGGGERATDLIYRCQLVTVKINTNQSDSSDVSGATVTVESTGINQTLTNNQSIKIPFGASYTITASAVDGYATPEAQTLTASNASAEVTMTYQTEIVTVTVTCEDGAAVTGQKCTINGTAYTLTATGQATAKVPFGTAYSVSVDSKSGYILPPAQSFTAGSATRAVTMTYETVKLGVFIQDTTGKLWTTDSWTGSATPNAIAVLTENCKVLVALTDGGTMKIHNDYYGGLDSYMTAISDETAAKADYDGKTNTANIMKVQSGTDYAAGYCNAFTFPDGKTKGYLPALGEFYEAYLNKDAVDAALAKCGGTAINTSNYHWSSTYYGWGDFGLPACACHALGWSNGEDYNEQISVNEQVRPFATYEA